MTQSTTHELVHARKGEVDALRALAREVSGVWMAFEPVLRGAMGNTNYAVVAEKLAAALGETVLPPRLEKER